MQRLKIVCVVFMVMVLTACGRRLEETPIPTVDTSADAGSGITLASLLENDSRIGDPANPRVAAVLEANPQLGETLFNVNDTNATCSSCHVVNSDQRLVGPGFQGLLQRASTRVSDESAVDYLYNSIVDPNVHIVEGYPQGVMPQTYGDQYTEAQLHSLVAYLLTLDEDGSLLAQVEAETTPDMGEGTNGEAVAQAATQTPYIIIVTATPEPATPTPQPPTATPAPPTMTPTPAVVAVQPTTGPSPTPDQVARIASVSLPSNGERLFEANCASCHAVDTAEMGEDGPGLLGIPQKAEQAPGQSAASYLYNSIVSSSVHAEDYGEAFSQSQLYDLTAYLLTLDADATVREGEAVEARETESEAESTDAAEAPVDDTTAKGETNPIVAAVADADPQAGEALWGMIDGGAPCSSCHNLGSEQLVGPGMAGIADRAATRTDNPAEVYLYNSIVHPNDYIVEGYPEGVMPQNYGDLLTDEQVYDLTAYLLTLDE